MHAPAACHSLDHTWRAGFSLAPWYLPLLSPSILKTAGQRPYHTTSGTIRITESFHADASHTRWLQVPAVWNYRFGKAINTWKTSGHRINRRISDFHSMSSKKPTPLQDALTVPTTVSICMYNAMYYQPLLTFNTVFINSPLRSNPRKNMSVETLPLQLTANLPQTGQGRRDLQEFWDFFEEYHALRKPTSSRQT